MPTESLSLIEDPAWPWNLAFGMPAIILVALVLLGLTVWTYRGVAGAGRRRVAAMAGLRILALVLACLMALRPSLARRIDPHEPSTLLLAADVSASMTTQDMFDGQSRWDYLRRLLRDCEPALRKLREEQNVSVALYGYGDGVREYDPNGKADGKRTDTGQMLRALIERHGHDPNLRGLLVLSDGADNVPAHEPLSEAARWRSLPCPIQTFGVGQPTTSERQSDIAFTGIYPEPTPVAVKGKLTVKGVLDAPGFENAVVTVRLLIDDKEVLAQQETLHKAAGNEVALATDAPDRPGEVKVTLKVDPLPKELTTTNNQIDTFVTVTKEGVSVLLVDKARFPEPQRICDALSPDPRIRLYVAWLRGDAPPEQPDLFRFDRQHYDVIVLGDVSARRLAAGNPQALEQIRDQVRKGAGLLMMGGYDSFGSGDWKGTPIEEILPVRLEPAGQVDDEVAVEPTAEGLRHFVMRLSDRTDENKALWGRLPKLTGMNRLGDPKTLATVLAYRAGTKEPMLVAWKYGDGRVLAFAGDTTWRWERLGQPKSKEGLQAHERFWKQLVLWLARQDEAEGSVWVKPDVRRLPAGDRLGFAVGVRGKGGVDLKDGHFEAVVVGPNKAEDPVPTAADQGVERGTVWKTEGPGEYVLKVRGRGKDADGTEVSGEAGARFVVYQEDLEITRRAADHDFLTRLANAGGGKFRLAEELPGYLRELATLPPPQGKQKTELWPDWRRNTLSGFLWGFLFLFVAVLCLEWLLRRRWGLV